MDKGHITTLDDLYTGRNCYNTTRGVMFVEYKSVIKLIALRVWLFHSWEMSSVLLSFFGEKTIKMEKYNKLDREQVLQVFQEKLVVNRADITKKYGCSVYSVRQIVDDLLDNGTIKLTTYGYKKCEK